MKKLLTPTLIFLSAVALTYFGAVSLMTPQSQPVGIALPQAVAIFETSLQTGITKTATSMTLTANSIRGTGSLSGFNCFTVDESSSNAEVICGTVSGTAVSSLTRGISYEDGETEVAGNKYSHRRGSSVKITDFPIIQRLKAQNNGEATFVNQLTYESYLTPVDDEDIISKKYADDLAIAGSPDASLTVKGLTEIASQTGMASTSIAGSGDTTAWLSLTSAYSTSTPSGDSYSGLFVPVSENDGKLSQLWTRLSDAYTWTGAHIFSSTVDISGDTALASDLTVSGTTAMATTTIADLTITEDLVVGDDLTVSGASTLGVVTSTTFTNSGTASTTDMIISGSCTGCGDDGIGTDTLASGTGDDSTVVNVGFRPSVVHYVLSAADSNESGTSHGFTDGTTTYGLSEEGGGAPVLDTLARTNTFADGRMQITIGSFTSTGFTISYDRQADTHVSEAIVRYIAVK